MFVESARRPFSLSGFTTSAASWSCCIVLRDVWHASDFRSRCQNPSQHAIFIIRMAYANRESLLTFACRRCESNQGFLKPCLDSAGVNIACLERWTMNEDVRSSSWTWGVFIAVPMLVYLKIRKLIMQVQQMVCRFPQKLAVLIYIYNIYILRQKWLFGRRSFPFCYVVTYKEGISRFHIRGPIQGRGQTLTYWWILSGLIPGHKNTGAEKKQQLTTQSSITTKLGGCFLDIITVIFTPTLGEIMIPFEEHIFQMGCFNHQPMSKKFYAPNSCRVLDLAYDLPRWSP